MITETLRRRFLDYFKQEGHSIISSSPVVPFEDPSLLFINAGMNQFKDVFLGKTARDYNKAVTSQKCIRVGGKHNDLENVGHTRRHLTFFEMLGNFSFGAYFKEEAIRFAWEVSTKVFELDPNRIWPTVFREDDEAFLLWQKYVPKERITRFDEKDNFWSMGETGPCGPCSELLYDRGEIYGTATKPSEDPSGERFMEFWNLVFMQYNRDETGKLNPLPKPSIDTGAGLERVVSLKMGVDSVFETDVLRALITKVEEVLGVPYHYQDEKAAAFRVIADHLRALSFAIADGVQPSNVDRGYVLRKILRRAVRYGRTLGADKPFLAQILPELVRLMGHDYPELVKAESRIAEIMTLEEEGFFRTLKRGGNLLNHILENAKKTGFISGDEAFKLKDTYGLPLEEISLIAIDSGLEIDLERFKVLENEAKEKSRQVHKGVKEVAEQNIFESIQTPSNFVGYEALEAKAAIVALIKDGQFVDRLELGDMGWVVLDKTPFYSEMGGQVGDTGTIMASSGLFAVEDTRSPFKGIIAHKGLIQEGSLSVKESVDAQVEVSRRRKIESNHTATHLLHWALHQILGEHVKQAGSVVDDERLRFDFSHHKSVTAEEVQAIEDLINDKIRQNTHVKKYELSYEEASKRADIKQFFGEKYGSKVRVIDIEESKELCGGTHIADLGKIGLFRIVKENSIAAGVRRIEAVTGKDAELEVRGLEKLLDSLASELKVSRDKLSSRLSSLLQENKDLARDLKSYKKKEIEEIARSLIAQKEMLGESALILAKVNLAEEDFKILLEDLSGRLKSALVLLANVQEEKVSLTARVSDDLVKLGFDAGKLIKKVAPIVEGTGGGKPNSAQAGGKAPSKTDEALALARSELMQMVS